MVRAYRTVRIHRKSVLDTHSDSSLYCDVGGQNGDPPNKSQQHPRLRVSIHFFRRNASAQKKNISNSKSTGQIITRLQTYPKQCPSVVGSASSTAS
jgi:hypothetical protein